MNQDLLEYIRMETDRGVPDVSVWRSLADAGWDRDTLDRAWQELARELGNTLIPTSADRARYWDVKYSDFLLLMLLGIIVVIVSVIADILRH